MDENDYLDKWSLWLGKTTCAYEMYTTLKILVILSWAKSQIERCIYAFNHEITEEKIITDYKTVDNIVEEIAEKSGLTLLKDKRGRLKKLIDRSIILMKHIR